DRGRDQVPAMRRREYERIGLLPRLRPFPPPTRRTRPANSPRLPVHLARPLRAAEPELPAHPARPVRSSSHSLLAAYPGIHANRLPVLGAAPGAAGHTLPASLSPGLSVFPCPRLRAALWSVARGLYRRRAGLRRLWK